jgi:hypothetical protein
MELSNPLRPKNLRPLPTQEETKSVEPASQATSKPIHTKPLAVESGAPEVQAFGDEIQKAIALLSKNGIQLAGPKKIYMKHSFEVEKSVFEEFMKMYPSLGQKIQVKEAATEAFKLFNDKHRPEFDRIKKST